MTPQQKELQKTALELIEEIKELNHTLFFHERHKSKETIEQAGLPVKFQNLLHEAYQVNSIDGTLSFQQIFENFLQMCLVKGVVFPNPFLVVFYENQAMEINKLFDKKYENNL
jgi:hypothetical protein